MRKFAFLSVLFCLVSLQSALAQPRDLFAEFEAETAAENADSTKTADTSAKPAEAPAAPASSSSAVLSSSSVAAPVSSSSVTPASSSAVAPVSSSAVVPADSATVKPDSAAVADTAATDTSAIAVADTSATKPDSAAVDSLLQSSSSVEMSSSSEVSSSSVEVAQVPSSSSMSRRDLLGPVKVSKVYGIDEMKGRYKSPRKAMFMSMVIPGSGQLYVGGSTFTNIRGVAYLALEAALWGGWYYNPVYKYEKQVSKYKKFAKNHFSIGRFESQMRDIYLNQLSDETEESRFETRYMSSREDFCKAIYGDANASGCYTKGKLFTNDKAHTDRFSVTNPSNLGKEIKNQKNFYDMSQIYQLIGEKTYVLGWDDVDSVALGQNLLLEEDNPESIVPLGTSKNLSKYRSMRNKANDYADLQIWFFGGIILNHLVSAVDAAFTANAHNKELYSEELSWYDHIHFDSYLSFLDGFDVGVQASWGF